MRELWPIALGIVALIGLLFAPLLWGDARQFWAFFPPAVYGIVLSCVAFWTLLREQKSNNKPGA